jgi:hypothetical protein
LRFKAMRAGLEVREEDPAGGLARSRGPRHL